MSGQPSLLTATRAHLPEPLPDTARAFFAPGRANLLGAHLDYNGGCVMPVALSQGTCLILVPRADRRLRMRSANFPGDAVELSLDELRPRRAPIWSAYLEGACYVARQAWGELPGFDLWVHADLPMARGLSSSASVQAVALFGLARWLGRPIDPAELIGLAHRSETEYVGVQCGVLDPTAIFLGLPDRILRYDCAHGTHEHLPLPAERVAVAVMDSGVKRELADSAFNERVAQCASAFRALAARLPGLEVLADLTAEQLAEHGAVLSEVERRRARHVVTEVARTRAAGAALRAGDLAGFGAGLTAAHHSLREDYEVSTPELDALVEAATASPGCFGSRLTGAGFGGCTVAILDPAAVPEFQRELPRRYREATGRDTEVMVFRPAGGPAEWPLD